MHINDVLFLLTIPKQDQELSPCSCSGLSLPGRGHVLVRCSHTVTGLRTLFLFLPFLDLLWNSLVPFTPYPKGVSKGEPEATSKARPKAKNPRGRRPRGFLAFGLAEDVAKGSP